GLEQVGGMEEGALLEADVHEGGLNAGEDGFDLPQVDIPHGPPVVGAVDEEFYQAVVFQDGHAGVALAAVDEDLAFHAGSPWGFGARHAASRERRTLRPAGPGPPQCLLIC